MRAGEGQHHIAASALIVALALPACFSVPSFPNQRDITDLRILAIKADPQLVAPGGSTEITALVVSPDGPVPGADYRWWWCGKVTGSEGSGSCSWDDDGVTHLGISDSIAYTAPADVLDQQDIIIRRYGFRDVVNLEVSYQGQTARSFARVQVQRDAENKNPALEGLIIEGAVARGTAFVVKPEVKYVVSPAVGAGSRETFTTRDFLDNPVTLTEELEFSWYSTGGSLSDGVTVEGSRSATHWKAPDTAPDDGKPLWVFTVVYDGRGGTDWWAQAIYVEE